MSKIIISFFMVLCFVAPTLTQAMDTESFHDSQQERMINLKVHEVFNHMTEVEKGNLKQQLLQALDNSEQLLEENDFTSTSVEQANPEQAITNLKELQTTQPGLNNKGFSAFLKGLNKHSKKKMITSDKAALKIKVETLKAELLSPRLTWKTVKTILIALAGIAYIYALLLYVFPPVLLFLITILGAVLGIFGVYLGVILAMGIIIALVAGPIIIATNRRTVESN